MDTATEAGTPAVKFPTPKDISKAARKAFPKKSAVKKAAKPKKKVVKAKKAVKAKKSAKKAAKPKAMACVRSERLDLRLTKAEKGKIAGKAAKLRRTVTSIVIEAIEKIK